MDTKSIRHLKFHSPLRAHQPQRNALMDESRPDVSNITNPLSCFARTQPNTKEKNTAAHHLAHTQSRGTGRQVLIFHITSTRFDAHTRADPQFRRRPNPGHHPEGIKGLQTETDRVYLCVCAQLPNVFFYATAKRHGQNILVVGKLNSFLSVLVFMSSFPYSRDARVAFVVHIWRTAAAPLCRELLRWPRNEQKKTRKNVFTDQVKL